MKNGEREREREVFTIEAANALLPTLSALVTRQFGRRTEIEDRLKSLSALVGEVPSDLTPQDTDPEHVREIKRDLVQRINEYQEGWRDVEALGAVVKDPRIGLLDFFGEVDGRAVWLCWKYGEPEVGHYHALDEGFAGRRAIRTSLRQRMLN
ncbi:DUF2203 domain-containing protein [Pendulispora rubella]|uniref:DUF2203 domain-containing protein n=1 Tax=Pendulispora rubella TaxID=2741070 RepID=A0ABZ2LAA3_9BACT